VPIPSDRRTGEGEDQAGPAWFVADLRLFLGCFVGSLLLDPFAHRFLTPDEPGPAVFWPVAGIGVALLARRPPSRWPAAFGGLAGGPALVDPFFSIGPATSAATIVATSAELLIVALLLRRRFPAGVQLSTPATAARLSGCIGLGIGLGALGYTAMMAPGSVAAGWQLWQGYLRAHLLGVLIVAPMLLLAQARISSRAQRRRRNREWLLQLTVLSLVTGGVFLTHQQAVPVFVCVLPLAWGSLRLGTARALGSLQVLATITTAGTLLGLGPLGQQPIASQIAALQLTLVTAAAFTLFVALAAQRKEELLELTRAGSADLVAAERIAGVGSATWDMASGEVRWSDGLYAQLQTSRAAMPPDVQTYMAMVHPQDREVLLSAMARLPQTGTMPNVEYRLLRPDGSERTVLGRNRVERDDIGRPIRLRSTMLDVTESRAAEVALRNAHAQLAGVLDAAQDVAIVGVDASSLLITFWGKGAENLLGWSAEEVVGLKRPEIYHTPEEMAQAVQDTGIEDPLLAIGAVMLATGHDSRRWTCRRKDGSRFPAQGNLSRLVDDSGQDHTYFAVVVDLTKALQAEAHLQESEDRFRLSFDFAPVAMAIVALAGGRPERIQRVNPALCRFTGLDEQALVGRRLSDLMTPAHAEAATDALGALVEGGQDAGGGEWAFHRAEGGELWGSLSASVVRPTDGRAPYLIAMIEDITARMQLTERLRHEASHDPLTGLPNRQMLRRRLDDELAPGAGGSVAAGPIAVLYIDLDGFKTVNDTLGHAVGDDLLVQVADRIAACVRASDVVARLGGDEFAVLLPRVGTLATARQIGERIVSTLAEEFDFDGVLCRIGASIGIVLSTPSDTPQNAPDLLNAADEAMYRAKRTGKGRVSVSDRPAPGAGSAAVGADPG